MGTNKYSAEGVDDVARSVKLHAARRCVTLGERLRDLAEIEAAQSSGFRSVARLNLPAAAGGIPAIGADDPMRREAGR